MHIAPNATFYTQRNNNVQPWSHCGVTSLVNAFSLLSEAGNWSAQALLGRLSAKAPQPEDALAREMNKKYAWGELERIAPGAGYSPWNDSRVLAVVMNHLAKESGVSESDIITRETIFLGGVKSRLDTGFPVVAGGKFTSSGHFVCFAGYEGADFLVRDSWGDYRTGYSSHNGKDLEYSKELIDDVIFNGGPSPVMTVHM